MERQTGCFYLPQIGPVRLRQGAFVRRSDPSNVRNASRGESQTNLMRKTVQCGPGGVGGGGSRLFANKPFGNRTFIPWRSCPLIKYYTIFWEKIPGYRSDPIVLSRLILRLGSEFRWELCPVLEDTNPVGGSNLPKGDSGSCWAFSSPVKTGQLGRNTIIVSC